MGRSFQTFSYLFKGPGLALISTYPVALDVKASHCLLQAFFEGSPDGHYLSGGFHLCSDPFVRSLELVKRPPWDFCHNVVKGRLKAGRRLFGDVISNLIE